MPVLDTSEFDFSQEHALGADKIARRMAVVRNQDEQAVLHVGVKSPVPWLELYPAEFALAPQEAQTLTVELRPERAGHAALAPRKYPHLVSIWRSGRGKRTRCRWTSHWT